MYFLGEGWGVNSYICIGTHIQPLLLNRFMDIHES